MIEKMGHELGLPKATLLYVHRLPREGGCDVLIDGEPVAYLPAYGVEFAHNWSEIPRMKLVLPAYSVEIGSLGNELEDRAAGQRAHIAQVSGK